LGKVLGLMGSGVKKELDQVKIARACYDSEMVENLSGCEGLGGARCLMDRRSGVRWTVILVSVRPRVSGRWTDTSALIRP